MNIQHNDASINQDVNSITPRNGETPPTDQNYGLIGNTHIQVLCCSGQACYGSGSLKIIDNFIRVIADYGLGSRVDVVATGCFGFCAKGPIVSRLSDTLT